MRLHVVGKRENSSSSIRSLDPTLSGWIAWLTNWMPFYASAESGTRKILYKKIQSDKQLVPIGHFFASKGSGRLAPVELKVGTSLITRCTDDKAYRAQL